MSAPATVHQDPMPLFPSTLLTVTALISMIGLAVVGWVSTLALDDLSRTDVYPELQGYVREIVVLDEVLTMAARMAAATGETRWIGRYDEHEIRLADALAAARTLDAGFAQFIDETQIANDALVEIERRALIQARSGRRTEAMALLDAPRYREFKADYAAAMGQAIRGVHDRWQGTMAHQKRLALTARVATVVAGLLLALIWGLSIRALNGWRQATMVARQHAEAINARLEDAVSAGRLGVFALPAPHGSGELSPRAREILGVEPRMAFTESMFVARVDAVDRAMLASRLRESWQPDADDAVMTELRIVLPDGGTRWIRAAWRVDRRGEAQARLHGVIQDIDEEKRLAERLSERADAHGRLADERLEHMQALVRDLMRTELHERQRLARILHDDVQQSLVAARMQAENEAAAAGGDPRRLRAIIDLLGEAHKATRSLTAGLRPAPIDELGFGGALEVLVARVEQRFGLRVELTLPAIQPPLAADVAQFAHAVVQELLFNTVRHAGVSSAAVSVSVADRRLLITVSDAGGGFDVASLSRQRHDGGFGLSGLQRQATAFDGRLVIESAPGEGSRMTLALPIGDRRPTSRPMAVIAPVAQSGARSLRVVIVDDSEPIRAVVAEAIAQEPGFEVVGTASSAVEGVALVVDLRPDLVVMDYAFAWPPDGAEATRRIRAAVPEAFVIGFAGFDQAADEQAMRAAGAGVIVRKGETGLLIAAIRARLGQSSSG